MIYVCQMCGYEYEPKAGEPESGVREGTEFDELPSDWECPMCGASKDDFEPTAPDEEDVEEL